MDPRTSAVVVSCLAIAIAVAGCADGDHPAPTEHEPQPAENQVVGIDCTVLSEQGYEDGVPFDIEVIEIDDKLMEIEMAGHFLAMRDAAAADGVSIQIVDGFRTMDRQIYFWNCSKSKTCNDGNPAAPPGYSNHQNGTAVDINRHLPGAYDWMDQNAARFGFEETVPGEPWHWDLTNFDSERIDACIIDQSECPAPCYPESPIGGACFGDESLRSCIVGEDGCTHWTQPNSCGGGASSCFGDDGHATCCEGTFCDDDGHWAEEAIEALAERNVLTGCGTGKGQPQVCPNEHADRCQVMTVIGRATHMPTDLDDAFHDDSGLHCEPYNNAAKALGVTNGTGGGTFSPQDIAPRTHVMVFLARAYDLPPPSADYFTDDDNAPSWAQTAHNQAYEAGIIGGCGRNADDTLKVCGDDPATRAVVATMVWRAVDQLGVPNW